MTSASVARGGPLDALKDEPSDSDVSPRRSLRSATRKPSEPPLKREPIVEYAPAPVDDPDSPVDFSNKGSVERDEQEGGTVMEPPGAAGSDTTRRTFVCDLCHKHFSNAANMRRHRIRHSGVKPFECKFCQKKFFRKDHMREHMAHKHNTVQLECYFCQEGFEKEKDLIQHVIHAHNVNSRELHCHICAFSAPTIGRYLWHLSNSHPRKHITYHPYNGPNADAAPTMTTVSAMPKISKVFSRKRRAVEEPSPPTDNGDVDGEDSGSSVKQDDEMAENNTIPPALPEFGTGPGSVKYVSLLNRRLLDSGGEGTGSEGNLYLLVANQAGQPRQQDGNGGMEWKASSSRRKTTMPVRRVHSPTEDDADPGEKREHPDTADQTDRETADPVPPPPSASGTDAGSVNGKAGPEHKCPYCLIVYPDNVMYLLHKMLHSRNQPYKCAVCQHLYPNRYEFYAHIVNHRP
ncbi:zinc finger protein ztf-16-like isoform X2 [Paramacrobiotus metropolitanus]|uniref:zinc finger protein ztf-16-like isoform X2 n=1 Tax=Paramacrobiotus metropolitanus TaxID=2943436 RepID=UPI002445C1FE|nr:zinc finger protein ztf-16-like isoform X2 [Paramacrobiotus metropolitanus]